MDLSYHDRTQFGMTSSKRVRALNHERIHPFISCRLDRRCSIWMVKTAVTRTSPDGVRWSIGDSTWQLVNRAIKELLALLIRESNLQQGCLKWYTFYI
jgi:hypothetical protein